MDTNKVPLYASVGSLKGKRRTMEDVHVVLPTFIDESSSLFCVFDGHGGREVSAYLGEKLPGALRDNLMPASKLKQKIKQKIKEFEAEQAAETESRANERIGLEMEEMSKLLKIKDAEDLALAETFSQMDRESRRADVKNAGSTVAVCLRMFNMLYVANAGDARVVIGRADGSVERLTDDHNGFNTSEVERIKQRGGFIKNGRVLGMVEPTRAIGDHSMKKYLTCYPHLSRTQLKEGDVLIIACDGVWEAFETNEGKDDAGAATSKGDHAVVEFVRNGVKEGRFDKKTAGEVLAQESVDLGSGDNVTAICVFFEAGIETPGEAANKSCCALA